MCVADHVAIDRVVAHNVVVVVDAVVAVECSPQRFRAKSLAMHLIAEELGDELSAREEAVQLWLRLLDGEGVHNRSVLATPPVRRRRRPCPRCRAIPCSAVEGVA